MTLFYLLIAAALLLGLLIGLIRTYKGPTAADRLLSVQLLTTHVCAVLLVLAETQSLAALRDVALLFALLTASLSVAFVRLPTADVRTDRDA